ncbi:MAG TPA: PIN domain-containing protein [Nocardioides sp.]|nr:PIN domain-containing protein [Nocardioides sp.]
MILVDTSVWIDHLHRADQELVESLGRGLVATHPHVIGELALGTLRDRNAVLGSMQRLLSVTVARDRDVRRLVEEVPLWGKGLTLVDAHLLAATMVTPGCVLWTRDRRLEAAARDLGVAR